METDPGGGAAAQRISGQSRGGADFGGDRKAVAACGEVRFLVDKLAHASLLDAVMGSGAGLRIFPHNNLKKLERLLEASEESALNVVVTESIFSMDGDAADLHGLVALKKKYSFVLLLDEAHASGVYGGGERDTPMNAGA